MKASLSKDLAKVATTCKCTIGHLQVSRSSSNAYMLADNEQIRLQQNLQTRSLTNRQGESAFQYVRIFKILEIVHELLQSDKQATQRDLYYRLLYPPIFCTTKVPRRSCTASFCCFRFGYCPGPICLVTKICNLYMPV